MTPSPIREKAISIAEACIKRQIIADGAKLCYFKASEITKWARVLIRKDPCYLRAAERRLRRRKA